MKDIRNQLDNQLFYQLDDQLHDQLYSQLDNQPTANSTCEDSQAHQPSKVNERQRGVADEVRAAVILEQHIVRVLL